MDFFLKLREIQRNASEHKTVKSEKKNAQNGIQYQTLEGLLEVLNLWDLLQDSWFVA
jgi:hypothetical protein